jgi:hypothetical protein
LEALPLTLKKALFPLPEAIRAHILAIAPPASAASNPREDNPVMTLEELLGYLSRYQDPELAPLQAIAMQTEAIGDPSVPAPEHTAVLYWVTQAHSHWEDAFPLAPELASRLHTLLPLHALLAITDPDYLVPGRHPLHRMLDALQERAVGWQAELGRAGEALQRQVEQLVDRLHAWRAGDGPGRELLALAEQVIAECDRDAGRTERMTERVIAAEQGRLRAAGARLQAARMLNELSAGRQAPADVIEFLHGPWYDSLQLVLLKHGHESEEWRQVVDVTRRMLASLQPGGNEEATHRHDVFEAATRLPRELKRWLLSLQHDAHAAGDAISAVGTAHLGMMKKQPLAFATIQPLAVAASDPVAATPGRNASAVDQLEIGCWFQLSPGRESPLRARLVLNLEVEQQLLFVNHAGLKALEMDYTEFEELVRSGRAQQLDSGASFSRSLAWAAGIRSGEDLESALAVIDAQRPAPPADSSGGKDELPHASLDDQPPDTEAAAATEDESRDLPLVDDRGAQPARDSGDLWLVDAALAMKNTATEALLVEESPPEELSPDASGANELPLDELTLDELILDELTLDELALDELALDAPNLDPQADDDSAEAPLPLPETEWLQHDPALSPRPATAQGPLPAAGGDHAEADAGGPGLHLPMGSWLGFHDTETPLMARLAVHDRDKDIYIFVNRVGTKLRELSRSELLDLVARDLVDVVETRSPFRETVMRARPRDEE